MHIFLTGKIQVGKSTVIQHFLEKTGLSADGFKTLWNNRYGSSRGLYIYPFGEGTGHLCFRYRPSTGAEIFNEAFDVYGADILRNSGKRDIVIMDELGRFEKNAINFHNAVLETLDKDVPVLGVIKPESLPLLDAVRAHSKVKTIEVTLENRDEVLSQLLEIFPEK